MVIFIKAKKTLGESKYSSVKKIDGKNMEHSWDGISQLYKRIDWI